MFEYLGLTLGELQTYFLIFLRITTLLSVMPLFSNEAITPQVRILLGLFLTMVCANIIPVPKDLPVSIMFLFFLSAKEVLVGLCLGLFTAFLFETALFAGAQVSNMMGLEMMTMVDPTTEEDTDVVGQLFVFFATMLLFSINGHHFLLKALFDSFYSIPLTQAHFTSALFPKFIYMIQSIFVLGIKMGAPLIVILFLVRIVLSLLEKIDSEADVFSLSMNLSLIVGFYLLMFYWEYFSFIFQKIFIIYKSDVLSLMRIMGS